MENKFDIISFDGIDLKECAKNDKKFVEFQKIEMDGHIEYIFKNSSFRFNNNISEEKYKSEEGKKSARNMLKYLDKHIEKIVCLKLNGIKQKLINEEREKIGYNKLLSSLNN